MRLLFIINTPAQAYTWRYIIQTFLEKGCPVKILARDYGSAPKILKMFGFQYSEFKPIGAKSSRLFGSLGHFRSCYELSRSFSPTLVVGFGLDAAVTAKLLRKPCIVFIDDETPIQNRLTCLLANAVVTPDTLKERLGKKQFLIPTYKEIAYLHPNYFKPDITIFDDLKIEKGDKYVIIRINAFDAVHDIGRHGFSQSDQFNLVKELGKQAHVFISPEGNLPAELESFRLPIALTKIHHALFYAQLLVTDTQTMATESAILGTPAVRSNNFVGPNDMGNFVELEKKYDTIYSFPNTDQAIQKAIELVNQPDLKEQWNRKRQTILADKIDLTKFMVDFIENYPRSLKEYKGKRG